MINEQSNVPDESLKKKYMVYQTILLVFFVMGFLPIFLMSLISLFEINPLTLVLITMTVVCGFAIFGIAKWRFWGYTIAMIAPVPPYILSLSIFFGEWGSWLFLVLTTIPVLAVFLLAFYLRLRLFPGRGFFGGVIEKGKRV